MLDMAVGTHSCEKWSELQLGLTFFSDRRRSKAEKAELLLHRFEALRQLRHPSLCRYLEILVGHGLVFIASEHRSLTLASVLSRAAKGLQQTVARSIVAQVVQGLCHLNSHALVHGHLDAEAVLFDEGSIDDENLAHCRVLLTGHGLGHLLAYGRMASCYPLAPEDPCCLAPEVARACASTISPVSPVSEGPSCQPDVWGLGVVLLQMLQGRWQDWLVTEGIDSTPQLCHIVAVETSVELWGTSLSGATSGITLRNLLKSRQIAPLRAEPRVLRAGGVSSEDGSTLEALQASYHKWLMADGMLCDADLHDLIEACLILNPSHRPRPQDLASHSSLSKHKVEDSQCWKRKTALESAAVEAHSDSTWAAQTSAALALHQMLVPPMRYLSSIGMRMEHLYYWWSLAGGDVFSLVAGRLLVRPAPAILQLPLVVRDDDSSRGTVHEFMSEPDSRSVPGVEKPVATEEGMQFWDPPCRAKPKVIGICLQSLCRACGEADRHGLDNLSLRPESLYDREQHFGYQWLRVRRFRRLLAGTSRTELFREASEDIPPILRAQVWSAVLGGAPSSVDQACWAPFYENLLAAPMKSRDQVGAHLLGHRGNSSALVASPVEEDALQAAMTCIPGWLDEHQGHQGLRRGESQSLGSATMRLERIVRAVLAANPSLHCPAGLGALCEPLAAVFGAQEAAAFLAAQRVLHGFLWPLFGRDGKTQRRHYLQLFGALLGFADPILALHLQELGMEPEAYASDWFSTWFSQLLPRAQAVRLWDSLLLRPPQFALFIGVCLVHFFRLSLLALEEASHVANFLASCAQLVDCQVLVSSALALFQATPASVTLPVFPRHSAGEALLWEHGSTAMTASDPDWGHLDSILAEPCSDPKFDPGGAEDEIPPHQQLLQHATEQWRQCEWWRQKVNNSPTPPIITVDDLLSFRSCCHVLDARSGEDFAECHFQSSIHVKDADALDLLPKLPQEVVMLGRQMSQRARPTCPQRILPRRCHVYLHAPAHLLCAPRG
ncbi:TBCK [Symbiodinium natans]|uniref:non-specific serine/threonine protein kinase n=1 Tax=Symbiodinium natans TaxID=878477 RepID=A0A812PS88_9DINO|nr:TBCK [Symbiodinium natans]